MAKEEDTSRSQTPSVPNQSSTSTGNTPQGASTSGNSGTPSQGHSTPAATGSSTSAAGHASNQMAGSQSSGTQNSKRRRGLGVVTPNACTECRKKRAKCDGQQPCGRCRAQKDTECVYEIPVRQSKENLRSEIESLRLRQRSSDNVLSALVRPELWEEVLNRLRSGQSVENISEWLGGTLPSGGGTMPNMSPSGPQGLNVGTGPNLNSLANFGGPSSGSLAAMTLGAGLSREPQGAQRPPGVSGDMGQTSTWDFSTRTQDGSNRGGPHPDAMSWEPGVSGASSQSRGAGVRGAALRQGSLAADSLPRFRGLEQVLSPLEMLGMKSPTATWTSITSDINLVQHLLALYFCWEYPTFASLSKEHFLRDFQDGRHRFCSPILVNALLALGCRFSTQPMTRANPSDPYSSGDHFFKESQRLFYQETDHHSLTTIQALGIMSIREASCGRDSESWYYAGQSVRLAIEMGLHRAHDEGDEDVLAVQAATFWGAFALDHAWSLATGTLPQCSCFPHLPPKPAIIDDIEASLWVPYTDDGGYQRNTATDDQGINKDSPGAPLQRSCEQPSNVRSVYKCFCELSELVHQSLYILHSPGKPLTARDLLNIYTQYLNWYDRIPEVLRLGHNFTPAVLFAHMYYHFAILLLFRPLIKLKILGSKVLPRDVCHQAADAIQGLLRSYSQLYTLRRTPSFVPYFVLTSAMMHLAIGAVSHPDEPSAAKNVETAAKMDPHVSESLKQGISDLAEMAPCHHFAEQALNILRYLSKKWNIDVDIDVGDTPADEYNKLGKPYTSSLNFFAPNMQESDFLCDWGAGRTHVEAPGDGSATQKSGDTMDNPLFWPFPMQGRPILPSGKELERAGFASL